MKIRRDAVFLSPVCQIIICFIISLPSCLSSIYLYRTDEEFDSLPAAFGMRFSIGKEYAARLQWLKHNPLLCNTTSEEKIVIPADGMPVALLAQKGNCTFEEKARVAMSLSPKVHYVIIYDNEAGLPLKTMSAENSVNIDIGLQFISYESGKEILTNLEDQNRSSLTVGGLRILLDCYNPWLYPNGWVGWIMMLISCCGSVCLCVGTGFVRTSGSIIIIGAPSVDDDELLSEQEAEALPEVLFSRTTIPENGCFENESCTICLEDYNDGDRVKILSCQHLFHSKCITPWLTERHATCPLCKVVITPHVDIDGGEELNGEAYEVEEESDIQSLISSDEMPAQTNGRSGWLFGVTSIFSPRQRTATQEDASVPLLNDENAIV